MSEAMRSLQSNQMLNRVFIRIVHKQEKTWPVNESQAVIRIAAAETKEYGRLDREIEIRLFVRRANKDIVVVNSAQCSGQLVLKAARRFRDRSAIVRLIRNRGCGIGAGGR